MLWSHRTWAELPRDRTGRNGVTGMPNRANAERGRLWLDWMVEDLPALLRCGMTESLPLDRSAFASTN